MKLDGATVEVIRSYLVSAAEEMRRTLIRTAFNPVIYEVLDFGISIYDADLELIADAPGLAFFLGANDYAIRKGVAHVGMETMRPGDILLMNYPYWNSAHAADATLFAPVFAPGADKPFAFTCIRAHWMDLGAKDPGYVLDSTDMHQEGLIFPGTRIYKDGTPVKDVVDLIRFNSRMPVPVLGDLEAQVAATRTGVTRLNAILEKFGEEAFGEAIARIKTHSETLVRKALADLPRGTWEASDLVDDDGITDDVVPIHVRVTVDDDGLTCDFSQSSPAVRGPINIPIGLTETICKFVLKSLTTPEQRNNAGSFRALKVIAPEGNLFHAVYPSATYTQWPAHLALELVYKALAQGMPDRVAACSGGDTLGFMMIGTNRVTGDMYAVSNNEPVGWGASVGADGINATNHISGSLVRNTPIEVIEMKTGMMMESFEIQADSGGAGRTRGGAGTERKIRFVEDGEFLSITKRSKEKPWSLLGGAQPEANAMMVGVGTDAEKKVGTYRTPVKTGDRMIARGAGGAGFGDPAERAPAAVLEDVLDGYVSAEAARTLYKVSIVDGAIDEAGTAALRAAA
ncbi:hydantoinase B/oxoprolinase family protein [Sphingomonas oryzagri]|uniref:Hydantoinase B/oxoprolinase family protein n=1 Tax=Sphingomonas oryzagri TaxID=3042314 RepID=A0ABT6N4W1_9SPHN|nr:hydantoinase B/oxoprolinase family protein [Sphingomonas oryzagri]MDH7640026.1 hydantoinase B/oxoprolinase family protein [Sphingomonas oryzagri]